MKVAIACGGTGGHVFPGLAVAAEMRARGHAVVVLGTGRDVETLAFKEWSGETAFTGPADYSSSKAVMKLTKLWGSRLLSIGVLRTHVPDVLLAMGGYASFGPVLAARKLRIPSVLHEGNAIPGKATRFLSRYADVVAVNFPETGEFMSGCEVMPTGFPVRQDLADAARKTRPPSREFCILVIGGSQGAEFLNESMPRVASLLCGALKQVRIVHVAGERSAGRVKNVYKEHGIDAEVYGFVNGMRELYERTDVAIARSGASVCAELAAFGIPSLFIPFPSAADDHQTANARHYERGGGAVVLAQSGFTCEAAAAFIQSLASSGEKRNAMKDAMLSCAVIDAASQLADILEKTGR